MLQSPNVTLEVTFCLQSSRGGSSGQPGHCTTSPLEPETLGWGWTSLGSGALGGPFRVIFFTPFSNTTSRPLQNSPDFMALLTLFVPSPLSGKTKGWGRLNCFLRGGRGFSDLPKFCSSRKPFYKFFRN